MITALKTTDDFKVDTEVNHVFHEGGGSYGAKHWIIDQMVSDRAMNKVFALGSFYELDMSRTQDLGASELSYFLVEVNAKRDYADDALLAERYQDLGAGEC